MDGKIRRVATNAGVVGAHVGFCAVAPELTLAIAIIELALAAMVIITALYAPVPLSDRAFRMIPWASDPGCADRAVLEHQPSDCVTPSVPSAGKRHHGAPDLSELHCVDTATP
jgi:hypothetical protein